MKILIIGSGGHARVVADMLFVMDDMEPLGYITSDTKAGTTGPLGLPILGDDASIGDIVHDGVVVAIGDTAIRQKIFDSLVSAGENLVSVIHPSAIIAPDVHMGAGCMACPGAIVNTGSHIKDNTILNTGCVVDHDCTVGPHAHVAPGANLAGNVTISTSAFVGIGASVIPGIVVGENSTVGAGAAVVRDVPEKSVAVGVPARILSAS